MKRILIITLTSTLCFLSCQGQNQNKTMEKEVKDVVLALEKATAERNVEDIDQYLHKDYRVVANRFKGSKTATIITREVYLEMMKSQKIGGTSYQTEFKNVGMTDHTAVVDVLFKSDKTSDMHKYLVLIQDEDNHWKVVSDIPVVTE